jgi:hypothetical protein
VLFATEGLRLLRVSFFLRGPPWSGGLVTGDFFVRPACSHRRASPSCFACGPAATSVWRRSSHAPHPCVRPAPASQAREPDRDASASRPSLRPRHYFRVVSSAHAPHPSGLSAGRPSNGGAQRGQTPLQGGPAGVRRFAPNNPLLRPVARRPGVIANWRRDLGPFFAVWRLRTLTPDFWPFSDGSHSMRRRCWLKLHPIDFLQP